MSLWTAVLAAGVLAWLTKLAGQILAAGVMAYRGVIMLSVPFFGTTTVLPAPVLVGFTVVIVVFTVNAVNWIDGLDGLAADAEARAESEDLIGTVAA